MADAAWPFYVSAAVAGAAFGYVIQRGGFCLMRALANLFLMGDAAIARAYVLALLVAMVGVQALSAAGLVDIPHPAVPLDVELHRRARLRRGHGAGRRLLGQHVVPGGRGRGRRVGHPAGLRDGRHDGEAGRRSSPLRAALQAPTITIGDAPPTLATALGVSPWLVIAALWIAGGIWLARARGQSAARQVALARHGRGGRCPHRRRLVGVEPSASGPLG